MPQPGSFLMSGPIAESVRCSGFLAGEVSIMSARYLPASFSMRAGTGCSAVALLQALLNDSERIFRKCHHVIGIL